MKTMKPQHTIFYSWQSDLPKDTNQNAIRQALRDASSQVENEFEDIRIDLDEATRDASGSPNIPKMILEKIEICDIFICDLTTINANTKDKRPVPNPNVLIELGYAVATIGWDRIILVFNKIYGTFPNDLPFDIDRHRATPFSIKDKKDNNGKSQLSSVLKDAIKAIIEKAPLKPHEKKKLTPEQRKRELDISNLKLALSTIHIPTFDHFIEEFPSRIPRRIFYFKDYFASTLESNIFFIYDSELLDKLNKLKSNWIKSLSYAQHYNPDGSDRYYSFYTPGDIFPSEKAEKDFYMLVNLRAELDKDLKNLLKYIRNNYLEVDVEEASKNAFENYKNDFDKE